MKINHLVLLSAFFLIQLPVHSQAEYRVFVLKISKKDPAAEADYRLVESTLDPRQYRDFYPVAPDEEVTYTDTWRCYGRTDNFKPLCPNPKGQIPSEETPTS